MKYLIILLFLISPAFAQVATDAPLGLIGDNSEVTTMSENRDYIRVGRLEATTITQLTTITLTTATRQTVLLLDDGTTQSTTTIKTYQFRQRVPGRFVRRVLTNRNYHFNPIIGGFWRPMTRAERIARGIP